MKQGEERRRKTKQCFTSIQSRKLMGRLEAFNLCPSMDLVVFGTHSASSLHHQNLYRTIHWQKVATIIPDPSTTTSSSEIEGGDASSLGAAAAAQQQQHAPAVTCWSPSGRWIAVAVDKTVSLYGVEPLANPPGGMSGGGFSSDATEAQHSWTMEEDRHPVKALFWAHVGRAHPTAWKILNDEMEEEISWSYQSLYVDSTKFFLPPSGYLQPSDDDDHFRLHDQTTTTALPESKTPLSVLCLLTANQKLELYLHGRYRLMTLDLPQQNQTPLSSLSPCQVAMSNDLSYLLVQSGSSSLSLFHLPFLKRDRYPLQIVASLHGSISSHLAMLRESIIECANSWKSSLKPLDMKLQPLLLLLKNYGVDDLPLGVILKQYILVGHTSESASVASAMDQFFTSVQMNDQLLQRMERSLHGALANVESQARKGLLSPTQALCYEVQELAGHVQFHHPGPQGGCSGGDEPPLALQELMHASHQLWISVQTLLLSMIQARLQIRDFCAWLRSAGSQIKAKGTASNSVQRENAKKRRVPQAVIERLLSSLCTAPLPLDQKQQSGFSLSEHLLNISTSTLLKDTTELIPLNANKSEFDGRQPQQQQRPESPSSVLLGLVTSTPTVGYAIQLTGQTFLAVMDNPLTNVPESIVPLEFRFSSRVVAPSSCFSLQMRIGRDMPASNDPWNVGEEDSNTSSEEKESKRTYFAPWACSKDSNPDEAEKIYCRQWSVIAQAQENIIQLISIPLGWRGPADNGLEYDDKENHTAAHHVPFYLSAKMTLPMGGVIQDIGFYSDDGKSSLSSGNDSGTGKEGRQKLGILYHHHQQQDDDDDVDDDSASLDLWLVSYDDLIWQFLPWGESTFIDSSRIESFASYNLQPIVGEEELGEQTEDDPSVLYAQTRTISKLETTDDTEVQLYLCGSRGVGAVSVKSEGSTIIELVDLEEDEEPDEDDEDHDDDAIEEE